MIHFPVLEEREAWGRDRAMWQVGHPSLFFEEKSFYK
jgi:hypothetical protein